MNKLFLASLLSFIFSLPLAAEPPLRGMEHGEDFRVGPVTHAGMALGLETPGDRQYYLLELRGESPNHGFSRIFLRTIALYELLELPQLNVPEGSTAAEPGRFRFHHQFITLGFESPLFYDLTIPYDLEWGWATGFTLSRVTFKAKDKPADQGGIQAIFVDYPELQPSQIGAQQKSRPAQADAQFAGAELGSYLRYYGLYPLVPYASIRATPGSFLNIDALINGVEQTPTNGSTTPTPTPSTSPTPLPRQRQYVSAFQTGAAANAGVELYLGSRGVLALEYGIWNWNVFREQDWTQFLILKAGFLL